MYLTDQADSLPLDMLLQESSVDEKTTADAISSCTTVEETACQPSAHNSNSGAAKQDAVPQSGLDLLPSGVVVSCANFGSVQGPELTANTEHTLPQSLQVLATEQSTPDSTVAIEAAKCEPGLASAAQQPHKAEAPMQYEQAAQATKQEQKLEARVR